MIYILAKEAVELHNPEQETPRARVAEKIDIFPSFK
jgi:hypothetical protein